MKSLVPERDKRHLKTNTKISIVSGQYWKVNLKFYAKSDICRVILSVLSFFPKPQQTPVSLLCRMQ